MLANIIVLIAVIALLSIFFFNKHLSRSSSWHATITPLASIMGSGFLVCAPLLATNVGNQAIFAISALLLLAYGVGEAVRFNIQYTEPLLATNTDKRALPSAPVIRLLENTSHVVLAGAYFISVTYYLQLLSAFVLKGFNVQNTLIANIITTMLLAAIGCIGWWKGLSELEAVEKYVVSINLAMIGALLVGLCFYNFSLITAGSWHLTALQPDESFQTIRVLLGLLIVVQGFEISRFLGNEYPAEQRIKTMRYAQLISAAIYILFIGLITILFRVHGDQGITAIIDMSKAVATVLPPLIIIAAVGSQFSASVADFSGAEGLISEIAKGKLSSKNIFVFIAAATISLAWITDVLSIISLASRAFALFYAFQCAVAYKVLQVTADCPHRTWKTPLFGALTVMCLLVTFFGVPAG